MAYIVNRIYFFVALLPYQWCIPPVWSLPSGFVEEIVVSEGSAVSGTFAPNPKSPNGGAPPMLVLVSKEGVVTVVETPDTSEASRVILDLRGKICDNGERGLQSVVLHPNFVENNLVYLFYTKFREGCLEGADVGPWNVVERFIMNPETLALDYDTRQEIWRSPSLIKTNHLGGGMVFGNDGTLYITTGDSGEPDTAQPLNNSFGSIIRVMEDGNVPDDNPFTQQTGYDFAYRCADTEGYVPDDAPDEAVCSEVFAHGLRNPFRITIDPSVVDKVRFTIQDVGASQWEEISLGGTDHAGKNYEWPLSEGVCQQGSLDYCPISDDPTHQEPFHYYSHRNTEEGGCITGAVFVPEGIWPSEYQFLLIDYIFLEIYNLIERPDLACRTCSPPVPGYKNETFYTSVQDPDEHVNEARMTDMFFGPYQDTQALYVIRFGDFDPVIRIRYTDVLNQPPLAIFAVDDRAYVTGEIVTFDAGNSSDPDLDDLTFEWDFGDGTTSTDQSPTHIYKSKGEYRVTLTVTDSKGQSQQSSESVIVGEPPVGTILSPAEGDQFYVGQILRVHGEAFDSTGNPIPEDRLEWEVRKHHADHFHPFFGPTTGTGFDLSPAPEPEDFWAATNSFLKVVLFATDTDGLTTEIQRDVLPMMVLVDVDTQPSGLAVTVDGYAVGTPVRINSWVGFSLPFQAQHQPPYLFSHWLVNNGTTIDTVENNETVLEMLPYSTEQQPSATAVFCFDNDNTEHPNCTDAATDCCRGSCVDGVCTDETDAPSSFPSDYPSRIPSDNPSGVPSDNPSSVPSDDLSNTPSDVLSSVTINSSSPNEAPTATKESPETAIGEKADDVEDMDVENCEGCSSISASQSETEGTDSSASRRTSMVGVTVLYVWRWLN
jgi:PKD repeat protein